MAARTICSVYFDELKTSRPFRTGGETKGYRTEYRIPAAPKDGHELLVVDDAEELLYFGERMYRPTPVYADARNGMDGIADDVAKMFASTGIASGAGGPGVAVIAGDTPTKAELDTLRGRQKRWCRSLVDEAETDWRAGKKHRVGELHRKAARWLGEMNYEWVWREDAPQILLQNCPLCSTPVDSTAMICPNCSRVMPHKAAEYRQYLDVMEKAGLTEDGKHVVQPQKQPIAPPLRTPPQPPKAA